MRIAWFQDPEGNTFAINQGSMGITAGEPGLHHRCGGEWSWQPPV
jgi:hypothetical protein